MAENYYTAGYSADTEPYFRSLIGRAQALAAEGWMPYQGERFAQFTPDQLEYMQRVGELTRDPRSIAAAQNTRAGIEALYAQRYEPTEFNIGQRISPAALERYQIGTQGNIRAPSDLTSRAAQMAAAQSSFQGGIGTRSFTDADIASRYMSPYMQNVVGIQQREAQRQADIEAQSRKAQAVQSGAYGGSRQAILEAEAARNLAQQKGDIQAKGLQESYTQAQQQFGQEEQNRLAAQQANQQANLQVALSNLDKRQQAAVQNQAAILQMQGMSAEQAMQAAMANQQNEMQRQQANLQANLSTQQLGSQQSLEAQQANMQALLDAQRMAEQSRQFGANFGYQGLIGGLQGAGQLADIGQNLYGQNISNLGLLQGVGNQQQQQIQNMMSANYSDFLARQNQPYKGIEFESNIFRGLANPTGQQSMYTAPPSLFNQLAGAGMAMYGAGQMQQGQQRPGFGFSLNAKGGLISGGLMDLAMDKAKKRAA